MSLVWRLFVCFLCAHLGCCLPGPFCAAVGSVYGDADSLSLLLSKYTVYTGQLGRIRSTLFTETTKKSIRPFREDIVKSLQASLPNSERESELVNHVDSWLETDMWLTALCPRIEVTDLRQEWSFFDVLSTFQEHSSIIGTCYKACPLPRLLLERVVMPRTEIMLFMISFYSLRLWREKEAFLMIIKETVGEINDQISHILQHFLQLQSNKKNRIRMLCIHSQNQRQLKHSDKLNTSMLKSIMSGVDWRIVFNNEIVEAHTRKAKVIPYTGNGTLTHSALKATLDSNSSWLINTIHRSHQTLTPLDRVLWTSKLTQASLSKYFYFVSTFVSHKMLYPPPTPPRPHTAFFQHLQPTKVQSRLMCMQMSSSFYHEHRALMLSSGHGLFYEYEPVVSVKDEFVLNKSAERDLMEWAMAKRRKPEIADIFRKKLETHVYHANIWMTLAIDVDLVREYSSIIMT